MLRGESHVVAFPDLSQYSCVLSLYSSNEIAGHARHPPKVHQELLGCFGSTCDFEVTACRAV